MTNFKMIFKLNYLICLFCFVVHFHAGLTLADRDTGGDTNIAEASSSPKLTFPSDYLIFSYRLSANMKRLSQHWKSKAAMKHIRKELYLIWSNKLATDTMLKIISEFKRMVENENARNAILTVVETVSSILRRVTVRNFVYLLDYYKSLKAKPALLEAYNGLVRELVSILSDPPRRKLLLTLLTTRIRDKKVQKQTDATTLTAAVSQTDGSDDNQLEKSSQDTVDNANPVEETLEGHEKTTETPGSLNVITNEEGKVLDDGYDSNSDGDNNQPKKSSQDKADEENPAKETLESHGKDRDLEDTLESPGSPNVITNEESKVSDDEYDSNSDNNDIISTTSDDLNYKIDDLMLETYSDDQKLTEKLGLTNSSEASKAGTAEDEDNIEKADEKSKVDDGTDVMSKVGDRKSKKDGLDRVTDGEEDEISDHGKLEDLPSEKSLVLDEPPIREDEINERTKEDDELDRDIDLESLTDLSEVSKLEEEEITTTTSSSEVSKDVADNKEISDTEERVVSKKSQKSTTNKEQPADVNGTTIEENDREITDFALNKDDEFLDSEEKTKIDDEEKDAEDDKHSTISEATNDESPANVEDSEDIRGLPERVSSAVVDTTAEVEERLEVGKHGGVKESKEDLDILVDSPDTDVSKLTSAHEEKGEKQSKIKLSDVDTITEAEEHLDTGKHESVKESKEDISSSLDILIDSPDADISKLTSVDEEKKEKQTEMKLADVDAIMEVEEHLDTGKHESVKESKEDISSSLDILIDSPDADISKLTSVDEEKKEKQTEMKLADVDAIMEVEEHLDTGKHGSVRESKEDISSPLDILVDSPDADVSKLISVDEEKEEKQSKMKVTDVDAITEVEEHLDTEKHGSVKESKEDTSSQLDIFIDSPDANVSKLTSVEEKHEEEQSRMKLPDNVGDILVQEKNSKNGHSGPHEDEMTVEKLEEKGPNDEESVAGKEAHSSTLLDDLDDKQNLPSIKHSSDSSEVIVDSNLSEATDAVEQKNPKTKSSSNKAENSQENLPLISSEDQVHEKDIKINHKDSDSDNKKKIPASKDHTLEMQRNIAEIDGKSNHDDKISDAATVVNQVVEEETESEEDEEEVAEIMKIGLLEDKEDGVEEDESGEGLEEEDDDDDSGVEGDDPAMSVEEGNTDVDSADTEQHINSEELPIIEEKHKEKKVEEIIRSEVLENETTAPKKESTLKEAKDGREKQDRIEDREIDIMSETITKGEVPRESTKNRDEVDDLEHSKLETVTTKKDEDEIILKSETSTHNPNKGKEKHQNQGHETSSVAENLEEEDDGLFEEISSKTDINLGNEEDEEPSTTTNLENDVDMQGVNKGQKENKVPVNKLMEDGPEPDVDSTKKNLKSNKQDIENEKSEHPSSVGTTRSNEFEEELKPSANSENDVADEKHSKSNNSENTRIIPEGPEGENEHLNEVDEKSVENLLDNEDLGLDKLLENIEEEQTIKGDEPIEDRSRENVVKKTDVEEREMIIEDLGGETHSKDNLDSDKTEFESEKIDVSTQHDSTVPKAEKSLEDAEELPSEKLQARNKEPMNPMEENDEKIMSTNTKIEDEDEIVKHIGKSNPKEEIDIHTGKNVEEEGEENVNLQHTNSNDANKEEQDEEEFVRTSADQKNDGFDPELKNSKVEEVNEDNTSQKKDLEVGEENKGRESTKQKNTDDHLPNEDSTIEKLEKVNLKLEDVVEENTKTSEADGKVEEIQSDVKDIETGENSDRQMEQETDNVDVHEKSDSNPKIKSVKEMDAKNIEKMSTDQNDDHIIVEEKSKKIKVEKETENEEANMAGDSERGKAEEEEVHERKEQKNSTTLDNDFEAKSLAEKNYEISDSDYEKNQRHGAKNTEINHSVDKKFDELEAEENDVNSEHTDFVETTDVEDSKGQTQQSLGKTAEDEKEDTTTKDLGDDAHVKSLPVEKEAPKSANDDLLPQGNSVLNENESNDESTLQNTNTDHTSVLQKGTDADSDKKSEDIDDEGVKATLQKDLIEENTGKTEDKDDTTKDNLKKDIHVQEFDAEKVYETDKDDSKIEDHKTSETKEFKRSNLDVKNARKDDPGKVEAPDETDIVDNPTLTTENTDVCAIPISNDSTDSNLVTSPTDKVGSPSKDRFLGMKTFFSNIGRKFTSQKE